jgi:tetratricopeptide (TPR) repeat protein
MIPFRKIDHWEFVSKDSHLLIRPNYFNEAYFPTNNISLVKIYNKYFFFHLDGYIISSFSFDKKMSSFSCERTIVEYQQKFGFIDNTGQVAIPIVFENARRFSEDLAPVRINAKWGFINKDGGLEIKHKFDETRGFENGFSAIRIENKWGMISSTGEIIIQPTYEDLGNFHEGLAFFRDNGKYGYLNDKNEIVISASYDRATDFSNGFGIVQENFKRTYIDETGAKFKFPNHLIDCVIYEFSNGYAWFKRNSEWGAINEKFEIVIEPKYRNYYPGNFNKEGFCMLFRSFEYHHENGTADIVKNIGYVDYKGFEYWEDSNDPNYYVEVANKRLNNSPREALFQFYCGYGKDRSRHDILFEMGKVHLRLMEYDMAINHFTKAIEVDPNNFEYVLLRGNAYSFNGNFDKALDDYDKCKKIKDDDMDLYVNIWNSKFKRGDPLAYYDLLKAKELGYPKADELIKKYYQ